MELADSQIKMVLSPSFKNHPAGPLRVFPPSTLNSFDDNADMRLFQVLANTIPPHSWIKLSKVIN